MNSLYRIVVFFLGVGVASAGKQKSLEELDYRLYPRRTQEEAAVLEWGNSAIISALDASIAKFGPQSDQAALLEVECMPVLADPMNGMLSGHPVAKLDNAEEIHGNMAVMTMNKASADSISGYRLAQIAKASGAAALLVVNIDQKQLDDIYRLEVDEGGSADAIDIPVVMISYNSANVLTTATVTEGMSEKDIVNHGMPERIRLYVGGDRPFFEDVDRTMYLIHNLLTDEECDALREKAVGVAQPTSDDDVSFLLDRTLHTEKMINMKTGTVHQGMWQSPMGKGIEERLEQVTGFPKEHYTDFVADVFDGAPGKKSFWQPHDSDQSAIGAEVLTTISIYLDDSGPPIVFPGARKQPIKIQPRKGMAVVHHEVDPVAEDEDDDEAYNSIHAMMPTDQTTYMVRKYVMAKPLSNARRFVVPLFGMIGAAALLRWLFQIMVTQFGSASGPEYFDKLCVFVPLVIIFAIVQYAMEQMNKGGSKSGDKDKEKTTSKEKKKTSRGKRSKKD